MGRFRRWALEGQDSVLGVVHFRSAIDTNPNRAKTTTSIPRKGGIGAVYCGTVIGNRSKGKTEFLEMVYFRSAVDIDKKK